MRIDTSPKGMIIVATSSGKQVLRGMARLIHLSAWNRNSAKLQASYASSGLLVTLSNSKYTPFCVDTKLAIL